MELIGTDPYDETDPSPFSSNAINSSAYELASLTRHYLSSASTMSGIFKEVFTKPEFSMEDFLDHGYATVRITAILGLLALATFSLWEILSLLALVPSPFVCAALSSVPIRILIATSSRTALCASPDGACGCR